MPLYVYVCMYVVVYVYFCWCEAGCLGLRFNLPPRVDIVNPVGFARKFLPGHHRRLNHVCVCLSVCILYIA
ncbi:uncharacterized protein F4817DRAFT_225509 [Daldinia loculata]|uniref:uncharacterized protein n=1 Tax=Daldinia loculata TaxID=103429 RepID=UPI0020C32D91|nr:uncharacterized protein F4817DRAFT_225509 [Daldinia loculata]KAI1644156.1 hypothetical protein F4817DRAFT_225509 [Daldinia loculata]